MKRFAVLSARSALRHFKNMAGYAGAVFIEEADEEISLSIEELQGKVELLYIQFSNEAALHFFGLHHESVSEIEVVFFKIHKEEVVFLNPEESETFSKKMPAGRVKPFSRGLKSLENFREVKFYTQGQISFMDAMALTVLVTQHFQHLQEKEITGLEVGSWLGFSSYFIANAVKNINPSGVLFCMDRWANWVIDETADVKGKKHVEIASHLDIFGNFKGIMKTFNVWDVIRPMIMDANQGMKILGDNAFEFIFIDAGHQYDNIFHDIGHAVRLLKVGGLLMCHDCSGHMDDFPVELVEKEKNRGPTIYEGRPCYLGVTKALSDYFGPDFHIYPGSTIAFKSITADDKKNVEMK